MPDLASLVLAVDSTQVKTGTAALDGLTAAGARAEAASVGLGRGVKGVGAEAAAMAAAAQASARSVMDQAAGFKASTEAARINTLAMRETLVVAREISRGNFTRLPGSLTLLAQGVGSQGGIGAYASALAQTLGLIKQVSNAELDEAAASAAAATAGVEAAARRAAANVMAADTEVALAEAQLRVTQGTSAEAAAQARLAAAHDAVGAAAAEAAVAEDALAVAMGRSAEAAEASAAATSTVIGGAGIGLIGLGVVAGVAFGAIKRLQDQIRDDGTLTEFRDHLGLTHQEMLKLTDGVDKVGGHIKALGDVTVTFGDVFHGIWGEIKREASDGAPWASLKSNALSAFDAILSGWNKVSAGITAGIRTIEGWFKNMAAAWHGGGGATVSFADEYKKALAENAAAFSGIKSGAIRSAEDRMQAEADALKADRRPKKGRTRKAPEDHADDEIARLDEQILSAKIALTKDAMEEAALKVQQLRIERDKTIMDAQSQLNHHKINQAEFDTIKLRAQELDNLKERAVLDARDIKLLEQDQAARDQQYGFQLDALKFANDNAKSQSEHRKLELEMLDIQYQQKEADLKILLTKQQIAHDLAGQAITQANINNLPIAKARDAQNINRATMDPLQKWLDSVPHDAATITEALQQIEVKGFDGLASAIAGIVTGTEKMGQAFKHVAQSIIADIVQMTVKMLIFRALSSIFGSAFGGGSVPGNTDFTGGSLFGIAPRASGGPVSSGQTYLVGENGPELFSPSSSGTIVPNHRLAANDTQRGPIELKIGFGPAPDFAPYVQEVAGQAAGMAVKVSVDHTNQTIKRLQRPKISGGR